MDDAELAPLREAAEESRQAYAAGLRQGESRENPMLSRLAPYVLYETLGPTLPDGLESAAALWGLAHRCAMTYPEAVRRAGHADGNELFDAILDSPSGVTFTRDEYGTTSSGSSHPDKRIALELPEMLAELATLDDGPVR